MVEHTVRRRRVDALLEALGALPGPFAAMCVAMAVLWFPFRLYLDRGDPLAAIVAASGLHGVVWAVLWLVLGWGHRRMQRTAAADDDAPPPGASERRARARRGAAVGLGVGVPFFGALIALCLITGRSPVYTASFAVVLVVIGAVAMRGLRRTGRAEVDLL